MNNTSLNSQETVGALTTGAQKDYQLIIWNNLNNNHLFLCLGTYDEIHGLYQKAIAVFRCADFFLKKDASTNGDIYVYLDEKQSESYEPLFKIVVNDYTDCLYNKALVNGFERKLVYNVWETLNTAA